MIVLIDYGLSNLRSVQNAFARLGVSITLSAEPAVVAQATKLILPGVGAFAAGMAGLQARGLIEPLRAAVQAGKPLLGICLGMQLLFDTSAELGQHAGLGLLPGRVVRFAQDPPGLKVPHVGWNQLHFTQPHPLLRGLAPDAYAYFVHSYICQPTNANLVLANTDYGGTFASMVACGNVFGFQFHPEKSQAVGLNLLRNFIEWL